MSIEHLPQLERIEPDIAEIRQHVRAANRHDTQEPITTDIEFYLRNRKLHAIQASFGRFAVFATGDLAFHYTDDYGHTKHGILLKDGEHYYISTPHTGA